MGIMNHKTEQKALSKIVKNGLKINKLFVNCCLKDTSIKTRIETKAHPEMEGHHSSV